MIGNVRRGLGDTHRGRNRRGSPRRRRIGGNSGGGRGWRWPMRGPSVELSSNWPRGLALWGVQRAVTWLWKSGDRRSDRDGNERVGSVSGRYWSPN